MRRGAPIGALLIVLTFLWSCEGESPTSGAGDLPGEVTIRLPGTSEEITFVLIHPGTFRMGPAETTFTGFLEPAQGIPFATHEVTLTKPFYIGVQEVSQRQWEAVLGDRDFSCLVRGTLSALLEGLPRSLMMDLHREL